MEQFANYFFHIRLLKSRTQMWWLMCAWPQGLVIALLYNFNLANLGGQKASRIADSYRWFLGSCCIRLWGLDSHQKYMDKMGGEIELPSDEIIHKKDKNKLLQLWERPLYYLLDIIAPLNWKFIDLSEMNTVLLST